MKIYVVQGSCGEYSDRTEWPVKVFVDEEKAKELVVKASDRSREMFTTDYWNSDKSKNEFDPNMQFDYGTAPARYYYYSVELEGEFCAKGEHNPTEFAI